MTLKSEIMWMAWHGKVRIYESLRMTREESALYCLMNFEDEKNMEIRIKPVLATIQPKKRGKG